MRQFTRLNLKTILTLVLTPTLALPLTGLAAKDSNDIEGEARELTQQFVGQIRPGLQQAMAEGGPARAIEVCASLAPRIADAMSADSGWMIRRVSLNPRNASRAVPDSWERGILEDFDEQKAAGAKVSELVRAETVGSEYRYMQAQVAEGICLTCHGTDLPAAAVSTLSDYYPDDAATGYAEGDVRGAISLRKPLSR